MSRQNINVSFPDEETTLYKELTLESSLSYVPVSALIRNYIKEGMKRDGELSNKEDKEFEVGQ